MSGQSQGPGWWQASDGRWYPPEQHPSRRRPAPNPSEQPRRRLASERVVIQSPTSFSGSGRRIWMLTWLGPPWAKALTVPAAVLLVVLAWVLVLCWYVVFGVLLVPWRLIRRGGRKRRRDELRHREIMER